MMLPLKTTDVRLVRVDSSTGIVDQVVKLADAKETYDEAMTKFFLRRVVALRETYTRAQLQNNYDQSVLFTAPERARASSRATSRSTTRTARTSATASSGRLRSRS